MYQNSCNVSTMFSMSLSFSFSLRICSSLFHILSFPVLHYCSLFSQGLANCWWFNSDIDVVQLNEMPEIETAKNFDYTGQRYNMTLLSHFSFPNNIQQQQQQLIFSSQQLDLKQPLFSSLLFPWDCGDFQDGVQLNNSHQWCTRLL